MIPKPIAVAIVCLVTLVWAGAFAAQFLVTGYVFDGYLHTVFLIIVGGALGLSGRSSSDGKSSGNTNPLFGLIQKAIGNGSPPAPPPAAPASPDDGPPDPPRSGGAHRALLVLTAPWRTAT